MIERINFMMQLFLLDVTLNMLFGIRVRLQNNHIRNHRHSELIVKYEG